MKMLTHADGRSRLRRGLLLAERVREQAAGEGAPSELRIVAEQQHLGRRLELLERAAESAAPVRRGEVGRELEHRGIVEVWITAQVSTRGKHQERASHSRIALVFVDRNAAARDVRSDYEPGLFIRSGTRLRRN